MRYFRRSDFEHQRHISPISQLHFQIMLEEIGYEILACESAGSSWGSFKKALCCPAILTARVLWGRSALGDVNLCLAQRKAILQSR